MRRPFVISTAALALALLPAAVSAQTPPAQQPPAQPPAGQTPPAAAAPAEPAAPKLTFKANVGMLLVQVKPDQTAAFEEMIAKTRSGVATATDPALKQHSNVKVYKSQEPGAGGNAFYIVLYDPATPGAEYYWLEVINKTLTPEQQRDPATREMYQRFAGSIATMNILNLTPVGGGM
jgi:hypothetical protein